MKKHLENIPIDFWLHTGRVLGLSRPCFCIYGLSHAAEFVFRAVDELAREEAPASRKLTFLSQRADAFPALRLRLSPATNDFKKFTLGIENNTPILEFTTEGMSDVKSALQSWIDGQEDFCMRPRGKKTELGKMDNESGELWFWVTMFP